MTTINIQKAVVKTNLSKIYVENLELSKYPWYRILVPHNNGNIKLTGVYGKKARPTNRKHGYKSKVDIDIDIDPSGDNRIVSENNRSVTIDPGSLP